MQRCRELYHHGILGQKWGVRRYQNDDGSWTAAGKERYGNGQNDRNHKRSEQSYKSNSERGDSKSKSKSNAISEKEERRQYDEISKTQAFKDSMKELSNDNAEQMQINLYNGTTNAKQYRVDRDAYLKNRTEENRSKFAETCSKAFDANYPEQDTYVGKKIREYTKPITVNRMIENEEYYYDEYGKSFEDFLKQWE